MLRGMRKFYVYEHWRPDTNVCFWVGKGTGRRARQFKRNPHYDNIVAKLARLGMCVEVRMVESGLEEHEAFALEQTRITFWRERGDTLANRTSGGEGTSGRRHSEEWKATNGKKAKARWDNPEYRARVTPKLVEAAKKRRGISPSAETLKRMSESRKGFKPSEEVRAKVAKALIGNTYKLGFKDPAETRERKRQAQLKRFEDAEQRAVLSAVQKRRAADPEEKQRRSEHFKAMWKNPAYRQARLESLRLANQKERRPRSPIACAEHGKRLAARWADPAFRKMMLDAREVKKKAKQPEGAS